MRNTVISILSIVFGSGILFLGCSETDKQKASDIVAATTKPIAVIQDTAGGVAAVTPPGSVPNSYANLVMAITGALLVLERTAQLVIAKLPTKNNPANPPGQTTV